MTGGSNLYSIPGVIEALQELNPKSIIDIGGGIGKYGMLCKEYINPDRLDYLDSSWENYTDVTEELYDGKYVTKIQDFEFERDYDVALLIAVMCRFTKEEGYEILAKIRVHCKKIVLTIEKEQHGGMTQWKPSDFHRSQMIDLPYEYLIIC